MYRVIAWCGNDENISPLEDVGRYKTLQEVKEVVHSVFQGENNVQYAEIYKDDTKIETLYKSTSPQSKLN